MEEGANPVTYYPATVTWIPSSPDVPITIVTQPCTATTVMAPKFINASMTPTPEMSKRCLVTRLSDAPVLNLFGFVIRYGWKQESISVQLACLACWTASRD